MQRRYVFSLQNIFLTLVWLNGLICSTDDFLLKRKKQLCLRRKDGSVTFSLWSDVYSQWWHDGCGGEKIKRMPKEADDWYSGRRGCMTARSTKLDRGAAQKRNNEKSKNNPENKSSRQSARNALCRLLLLGDSRGTQQKTGGRRESTSAVGQLLK